MIDAVEDMFMLDRRLLLGLMAAVAMAPMTLVAGRSQDDEAKTHNGSLHINRRASCKTAQRPCNSLGPRRRGFNN
jgi:hypothetical protein